MDDYDRVTAVLAPFSGIDKIDPIVLQRAADRGNKVHALCQGIIEGLEVECPEGLKGYVDSFRHWCEGKNFLDNPGRMFQDNIKLTGECDGLFKDSSGEVILFDLKTSAKESPTWKYQSAGYALLLNNTKNIIPSKECFIRLSKDGKPPKVHVYNFEENIDIFLKCVDLYRAFYKGKIKISEEYL